jgi:hypothetical protein
LLIEPSPFEKYGFDDPRPDNPGYTMLLATSIPFKASCVLMYLVKIPVF